MFPQLTRHVGKGRAAEITVHAILVKGRRDVITVNDKRRLASPHIQVYKQVVLGVSRAFSKVTSTSTERGLADFLFLLNISKHLQRQMTQISKKSWFHSKKKILNKFVRSKINFGVITNKLEWKSNRFRMKNTEERKDS